MLLEVTEALDYIMRAEGVVLHLIISDEGNLIEEFLYLNQPLVLVFGHLLLERIKEALAFILIILGESGLDIIVAASSFSILVKSKFISFF